MLVLVCILTVTVCSAPQAHDDDFERWMRSYERGNSGLDRDVLDPLLRRGTREDGERLLRVLAVEWAPGAPDARRGRAVQDTVLQGIARASCPLGIQAAVLACLTQSRVTSGTGEPIARVHPQPDLAARLVPLLGVWHRTRFRGLLESFCRGREPALVASAAETLAVTGSSASFGVIGRSLGWLEEPGTIRRVVRALVVLHGRGDVAAAQSEFLLEFVLRRVREPSAGHAIKNGVLPLLSELRAKRSVPILIAELERVHTLLHAKEETPTGLSFYSHGLHTVLQDLTGFWAPASSPDRWWEFWQQENAAFEVRAPRRPSAGRTVAKGFFGIPVRGRRVLFVVDTSGSMRGKFEDTTRIERAKRELEKAVSGMDPEVEFNVIFFSDGTQRLARSWGTPTPQRLRTLSRLLRKVVAGGGTNLSDALRIGLAGKIRRTQTPYRRSVDEVFVLSDGAPRSDPARILEDVARWNVGRSARINTVYLGGGSNLTSTLGRIPHGRSLGPIDFMQRLAEENGGVFLTPR